MTSIIHIEFNKPEPKGDSELYWEKAGYGVFGLNMIVSDDKVLSTLETIYALPGVKSAEVKQQEESDGESNKDEDKGNEGGSGSDSGTDGA